MSARKLALVMIIVTTLLQSATLAATAADKTKTASVFFSAAMREKASSNAEKHAWAKELQKQVVGAAQPWMKISDDELWGMVFGPTIKRSWMVWSNGFCPSCKKDVPMYEWQADALERPWKMRCPHCKELFPKNDFYKFYLSGLDEHGIFDPAKADRSLLFNVEHPDTNDPLRMFGVDDGEGYVDGDKRWRFIGAYLIYGQWKQAIVGGIKQLAAAYVVTGDKTYAHKVGLLLDRVADLYPMFDFKDQGVMYEGPAAAGYVSTWHDACWETQDIAVGYDQVFDAIKDAADLQTFLAAQAKKYKLDNAKASFADIQRNIEDRILRDALANKHKIRSNFPQTDITITFLMTILGWPDNREEVMGLMKYIVDKTTAVDGVTGEKGLSGYGALGPQSLGFFLGRYATSDPGFIKDALARYPRLRDCYRFHIDTWCSQGLYYPLIGDCGSFAAPNFESLVKGYAGLKMQKTYDINVNVPSLAPSMFAFLWELYKVTNDPAFVQVIYRTNDYSTKGLPHDIFADDPAAFQQSVKNVIDTSGTDIKLPSVNKQEWHLGILRSGSGKNERALWLDYDSGGGHGHADGMNLGLFGWGLDLMPDFGYPPVQYGGWGSPRSKWYMMTAAHNTVVVDGVSQSAANGKTTLWADGTVFRDLKSRNIFRAIRASCPDMIKGKQYERTAALIDVSDKCFYALDIFRVVGGKDHTKFLHSYFGDITTNGLRLSPTANYTLDTQMRNFQVDPAPTPGWSVDWRIDDQFKLLPPKTDAHFRYTDLTTDAQAITAEQWISKMQFTGVDEAWIPAVAVRRNSASEPCATTFVGVIEPYVKKPLIATAKRLALQTDDGKTYPDANAAIVIQLADGRNDLFILADVENPLGQSPSLKENGALLQNALGLRLDGEMCFIRQSKSGKVECIALAGKMVTIREISLKLKPDAGFVEIEFKHGKPVLVSGKASDIEDVLIGKKSIWPKP